MADYLMGIDYGTGGAKACIINTEGKVLAYAFREYPIITKKPRWSEHDAHLYWQIAEQIVKECIGQAQIDAREIRGIGTSSALPSMVMVDKNHEPVALAYNLMDRRATDEVKWLKENIGEDKIFKLTGNRLDDHPLIVNLMWEKNNRPKVYQKIYKALTMDGFIRLKLTGKATVNYGAGAFHGVAWDIRNHHFDAKMLEAVDIDAKLLPSAYPCEEIIGEVTRQAAESTGLAPGTPICAGTVDCCAGWTGGGAIYEGDIHINLGSVGNFGIVHETTDFLKPMIACAHTIDSSHTYVTVPSTMTGGQLLRYIRETFSQLELEIERVLKVDAYELLNLEAEKIPPGSDGLVVLPYLMGERTPIWDVDARGVIFGLSLSHTKGHLVRAAMESVAYALYHNFEMVKKAGWKMNYPVVFNEGGAKSKLWRKIITDVINVPTVFLKNRTGAPYGDAILAGVATGVFKDFSVAREWAEYADPLEPFQENHQIYMEYFQIYRRIYEHLKDDFKELSKLRKQYIK
ncbi:FGGY-family carbohydrate kinase [Candidatus Aerophobetes bacterium]|nr:FGGY-family carbohydrate kinase [Candidatus Aerophobetes bacterium]